MPDPAAAADADYDEVNDATRTSDWTGEFVSVIVTESSCLLVGYSHCPRLSVCLSVLTTQTVTRPPSTNSLKPPLQLR